MAWNKVPGSQRGCGDVIDSEGRTWVGQVLGGLVLRARTPAWILCSRCYGFLVWKNHRD